MLRTQKILLLAGVVLALCSCGAKKNAAVPVQAQVEYVVVADSIPTTTDSIAFLGDLVNDSTIRVNWVSGIPFIIDDSVPMLLPPIDKNPEGYVSSRDFISHHLHTNFFINNEVEYIVDSLLWLNKCLNDIRYFLENSSFSVSHLYVYTVHLFLLNDGTPIIVFHITQSPLWACMANYTIAKQAYLYYAYDSRGNLVGKSYLSKPVKWKNGIQIDEAVKVIPESENIFSLIQERGTRQILIRIVYQKEDPNRPSPCLTDV